MRSKHKGNKLKRYMNSLLRLLSKPKDMYVNAMTACSAHFSYVDSTALAFPTPHFSTLPRSFSVDASSNGSSSTRSVGNDLKHLVLSSGSVRTTTPTGRGIHRVEFDRKPQPSLHRSFSTGIGRIDEDKPCEFGFDDAKVVVPHISPLRRSYAVHRISGGAGATRVF